MPRPRIYIETTIPSAYFTSRSSPDALARRDWTRRWWAHAEKSCELVSSPAVANELARGTSAHVPARLEMIRALPWVEATREAIGTAELYVRRRLMPGWPSDDALHLALASHHACDVLVTWNYRHLANPNKFNLIRRINVERGLFVPTIATPKQLAGGDP